MGREGKGARLSGGGGEMARVIFRFPHAKEKELFVPRRAVDCPPEVVAVGLANYLATHGHGNLPRLSAVQTVTYLHELHEIPPKSFYNCQYITQNRICQDHRAVFCGPDSNAPS